MRLVPKSWRKSPTNDEEVPSAVHKRRLFASRTLKSGGPTPRASSDGLHGPSTRKRASAANEPSPVKISFGLNAKATIQIEMIDRNRAHITVRGNVAEMSQSVIDLRSEILEIEASFGANLTVLSNAPVLTNANLGAKSTYVAVGIFVNPTVHTHHSSCVAIRLDADSSVEIDTGADSTVHARGNISRFDIHTGHRSVVSAVSQVPTEGSVEPTGDSQVYVAGPIGDLKIEGEYHSHLAIGSSIPANFSTSLGAESTVDLRGSFATVKIEASHKTTVIVPAGFSPDCQLKSGSKILDQDPTVDWNSREGLPKVFVQEPQFPEALPLHIFSTSKQMPGEPSL